MDENQIMINRIQKHIKNIHAILMDFKLFVVMLTDIANQYNYTKEKMLHINSWRKC